MQYISHQRHLDALPDSPLKTHIQKRFDQLSEDTDVPPNIVRVESGGDIAGPDYAFAGSRGLVSDLWDASEPGQSEFCRVFEWVSFLPSLQLYEALVLINNEDGYLIMFPRAVVDAHPDLKWVLTDESQGGLSPPQTL